VQKYQTQRYYCQKKTNCFIQFYIYYY